MTLDEFSKRCEKAAGAVYLLMGEFDDEDDPQGVRQGILVKHLLYVMTPSMMEEIGRRHPNG